MSSFLVTFRLKDDATYQDRYDSLVEQIKEKATGLIWEETSSVCIFKADGSASDICSSLYYNSKILESKDVLLVVKLNDGSYDAKGIQYPATLKSVMP